VTIDENGKEVRKAEKIKTRAGKSVKLSELLDEAKDRALATFEERIKLQAENTNDGANAKVQIENKEDMLNAAEVLGISSIKYYDLK